MFATASRHDSVRGERTLAFRRPEPDSSAAYFLGLSSNHLAGYGLDHVESAPVWRDKQIEGETIAERDHARTVVVDRVGAGSRSIVLYFVAAHDHRRQAGQIAVSLERQEFDHHFGYSNSIDDVVTRRIEYIPAMKSGLRARSRVLLRVRCLQGYRPQGEKNCDHPKASTDSLCWLSHVTPPNEGVGGIRGCLRSI